MNMNLYEYDIFFIETAVFCVKIHQCIQNTTKNSHIKGIKLLLILNNRPYKVTLETSFWKLALSSEEFFRREILIFYSWFFYSMFSLLPTNSLEKNVFKFFDVFDLKNYWVIGVNINVLKRYDRSKGQMIAKKASLLCKHFSTRIKMMT